MSTVFKFPNTNFFPFYRLYTRQSSINFSDCSNHRSCIIFSVLICAIYVRRPKSVDTKSLKSAQYARLKQVRQTDQVEDSQKRKGIRYCAFHMNIQKVWERGRTYLGMSAWRSKPHVKVYLQSNDNAKSRSAYWVYYDFWSKDSVFFLLLNYLLLFILPVFSQLLCTCSRHMKTNAC